MNDIKHIFFDLDHTLWDYETNSRQTLHELYVKHKLESRGVPDFDIFYERFLIRNEECWELYRQHRMNKNNLRTVRFRNTLKDFNIQSNVLSEWLGTDFVTESPKKTALFDGAHEVLDALSKKYTLHIITNGFEEVQFVKIRESGLEKYFQEIITSERAGARKPREGIFRYAFEATGATPSESLMIGDDYENDIGGALSVGMQAILFNPGGKEYPAGIKTIRMLSELLDFL
jgi:putative hydrolase of the HAD superfamily